MPGWKRALRRVFVDGDNFFSWGVPLFTLAGIRVRMHVLFIAYVLVTLATSLSPTASGPVFTIISLAILFGIVLIHEFGHCLACRWVGGQANDILLWPLGGLASCRPPHHWRADLITTLGGPAVHIPIALVLGGVILAMGADTGAIFFNPIAPRAQSAAVSDFLQVPGWQGWARYVLWKAYVINQSLFLFNMLLVMYPMDAGRVLHALLWRKMGYGRATLVAATVGLFLAVVVGLYGMTTDRNMLTTIAVFAGITCFYTRRQAQLTHDEPWSESAAESQAVSDRAFREAARKQQAERQRLADLEKEEDRILRKIQAEGMASITKKERRFLDELAEAKRNQGGAGANNKRTGGGAGFVA